jgi:hypothetical protein
MVSEKKVTTVNQCREVSLDKISSQDEVEVADEAVVQKDD